MLDADIEYWSENTAAVLTDILLYFLYFDFLSSCIQV